MLYSAIHTYVSNYGTCHKKFTYHNHGKQTYSVPYLRNAIQLRLSLEEVRKYSYESM